MQKTLEELESELEKTEAFRKTPEGFYTDGCRVRIIELKGQIAIMREVEPLLKELKKRLEDFKSRLDTNPHQRVIINELLAKLEGK